MNLDLSGVYQDEMKPFGKISEQDLDRLFSGKASTEDNGLDHLARLVQKGQSLFLTSIEPDVEAAHLAGLMQRVNLTDKGDLAARPASKVTGPHVQASGLPKRRRRFMLESLFATFATLASKIAVGGIAVAMAATAGLAGTGNLPNRAQTAVSNALDNVGIEVPPGDSAEDALEAAEEAAAEALERAKAAAELAEENGDQDAGTGEPNENADFGQSVADRAKDGGVDGQTISGEAREQAEQRRAAGQAHRPDNAGPPAEAGPPADAGTQSQTGLDTASNTQAGGSIPATVPGGPDTADQYKPAGR